MYNIKTERKKIIPTYLVSVRYERLAEGKGQEKRAQEEGTRKGHKKRAREEGTRQHKCAGSQKQSELLQVEIRPQGAPKKHPANKTA